MKNSLSTKLILLILLFVMPVFLFLMYSSYKTSYSILMEQTKQHSKTIINNAIEKMIMITKPIEKVPENIAHSLNFNEKDLKKILKTNVLSNENIFGMAAAFEPYQFNPNIKLFCPYVYKESGFITFTSLTDPEYDYLNQDWYLIAKKLNKPVWSEPYLDEGGGGVIMSTYSYPVTKNKKFIGVITADIQWTN